MRPRRKVRKVVVVDWVIAVFSREDLLRFIYRPYVQEIRRILSINNYNSKI